MHDQIKLGMPSLNVDKDVPHTRQRGLRDAISSYEEIQRDFTDYLGIEQRYHGSVPVKTATDVQGGLTVIENGEASGVYVDEDLVDNIPLFNHEFTHVLSESLTKYDDLGEDYMRLLMETIATYGLYSFLQDSGYKERAEATLDLVENTHPYYQQSFLFGEYLDHIYEGNQEHGIRGFIEDTQNHGLKYSWNRLHRCADLAKNANK